MNGARKAWGFYKKTWFIGAFVGTGCGMKNHEGHLWPLYVPSYAVLGALYPVTAALWAAEVSVDLIDRIKD
jgi:hypothetical protein